MKVLGSGKEAIVLSGGGSYGAYEVGILKGLNSGYCQHLESQPFDPDIFAGTSAGAVNCVLYVSNLHRGPSQAVGYLETFWKQHIAEGSGRCGNGIYRPRGGGLDLLDLDCLQSPAKIAANFLDDSLFFWKEACRRGLKFANSRESFTRRAMETIDISAFFDTKRIRAGLSDAVSLDRIRSTGKELRVIATNFETGNLAVFTEQDILERLGLEAILASSAVPGLIAPVEIDGQLHIDGGALLNTPLLRALGDTHLMHVVYMDPDLADIELSRLQNSIDVLDRIIVMNNAQKINEDLRMVRYINQLLQFVEAVTGGDLANGSQLQELLQLTSNTFNHSRGKDRPYRKLTVHRYHPKEDLGGALGFMNLGQRHISGLIQRGFHDAIHHDCAQSGCILS